VWDLETSRLRRSWPALGRSATKIVDIFLYFSNFILQFQCILVLVFYISLKMAKWLTETFTSLLYKINFSTMCTFLAPLLYAI